MEIKIVPELQEKYKETKPLSKPCFLFYRDGKIVGEVLGCDAPEIMRELLSLLYSMVTSNVVWSIFNLLIIST